jgi:hypothetical protein
MKKLTLIATAVFAFAVAAAGCGARGHVGPVHAGGGVSSR